MHDRNRMNGFHASPTALPFEIQILLGIKEDVGALKSSVNLALSHDAEIFEEVRKIRERLTLAEHRATSSGQPLTAPPGLLTRLEGFFKELGEVLAGAWRLAIITAWAATAASVTYNPDAFVALLRSLK
jgi:hypothetical protein